MLGRTTRVFIQHLSQAPVAHACYPSCSGGREQEDQVSKPAQANVQKTLSRKTLHKKKKKKNRALGVIQGEGPEFKLQYYKNKINTELGNALGAFLNSVSCLAASLNLTH
jgi:hypothetical protein